ncbi:hypothetical protein [Shewanella surugensis]|uniref:Uncharacterized protein n=1 Tax=Shewanella surugensis TaxID=212020 RepID=A0ABT0LJ79_9GAMM|nr:hypothetical protein [Shewanella surugensis]MCL1127515.1 hypothetical protein [Shewanella surugensis]
MAKEKKRSPAYLHLQRHFRSYKTTLIKHSQSSSFSRPVEMRLSNQIGALECLYWQALGNGERLLAQGIRRFIEKAKAHFNIVGL